MNTRLLNYKEITQGRYLIYICKVDDAYPKRYGTKNTDPDDRKHDHAKPWLCMM